MVLLPGVFCGLDLWAMSYLLVSLSRSLNLLLVYSLTLPCSCVCVMSSTCCCGGCCFCPRIIHKGGSVQSTSGVLHRGLHAETRTTTDTVHITDREARAGAYKVQILHDSQGGDKKHQSGASREQSAGCRQTEERRQEEDRVGIFIQEDLRHVMDRGAGTEACRVQVFYGRQGEDREQDENKAQEEADQEERTGRRQGQHPVPGSTTPSIATHTSCYDTERLSISQDRLYMGGIRDPCLF